MNRLAILISLVSLWITFGLSQPAAEEAVDRSLKEKDREIERLKRQMVLLEESLIMAKGEADLFQEKLIDLRLKHQALGLEALTADERAMQEKLVRIVSQLAQAEKDRIRLEEWLARVIDASKELQNADPLEEAQKRADYESVIRGAKAFLSGSPSGAIRPAGNLNSGVIVHVKPELGMVILNLGKKQGATIGMPFRIIRGEEPVGRCRVIEVRDYLCAALVSEVEKKEKVQAGDRLLLEAIK